MPYDKNHKYRGIQHYVRGDVFSECYFVLKALLHTSQV
jgi:hypothetical protein